MLTPALFLLACDSLPTTRICTEIGCNDGLRLEFDATPAAGTIVEVYVDGSPTPWTVECGVEQPCDNGIFFPDFTPEHATVRIITPAATGEQEIAPEYRDVQPNGPDCEPTCSVANVEVTVP